jgi:hypothetical protein
MRTVVWLLVVVAIGAIAWAEPSTGTVIVSCNEADVSLLVDGVVIPESPPAVLALPPGTHVIEARKPPLVAQTKTVEVVDQQQIKVWFELLPAAAPPPPTTGSGAPVGSGSGAPPAPVTTTGSGAAIGSGSAAVPRTGSAAPTPNPTPPPTPTPTLAASAPERHCRQGGREVPCPDEGPRCTMGGKPVPCSGAKRPPPPPPPAPPVAAIATGSGSGSAAPGEPHPPPSGLARVEIATTVAHAIAYVDGVPVRDAPCVLDLEPGEHVFAVYAAGMIPAESIFRAEVARPQRIELIPSQPRKRIDVPAQ